jgi:hypothetical protein
VAETYETLIDRVIENLGNPDAGASRDAILRVFRTLLEVDIPNRVGGHFVDGFAEMTVGGVGAPAKGRYDFPDRLRVPEDPFLLDDNPLAWSTVPHEFFGERDYSDVSTGKPTVVLIHAGKLWFRAVPPTTTSYTVVIFGKYYPDYSAILEATDVPTDPGVVAVIEAGATVLRAAAYGLKAVSEEWAPIFKDRFSALASGAKQWPRNTAPARTV